MSSNMLGNVWEACAAHDIKGAKLMIMARLADYSNDDGVSYPSVETICRQLGLGESTVRTAISELESAGWLRRESRRKGNRNTSNLYHLNADRLESLARIEKDKAAVLKQQRRAKDFHPSESEPSKSEPSESEPSSGFHPSESGKSDVFTRQNLTPDPQVNSKHDPQVNSKHESQDIGAQAEARTPAKRVLQEYSPEFETAWQAYPKRAGGNPKPAAWKAWKARLREGVPTGDLQAGVSRYAAYISATGNVGSQYVKQAATFFGPDRHFEEVWQAPATPQRQTVTQQKHSGFDGRDYGKTQTPAWARSNQ